VPSKWAESWQRSWDRLEEVLVPDRERQIRVLLDVVEAMAGATPTVIDLGCGTGTITCRLLDRLPRAHSIAVDVDPVLLTIASATFADDDRVHVVRADLRDRGWADALPTPKSTPYSRRPRCIGFPRTLFAACIAILPSWSVGVAWWRTANGCRWPRSLASGAHSPRSSSSTRLASMTAGPVGTPGGNRHPANRRFSRL